VDPDILGLESKTVRLVPYRKEWARLFRTEAKHLTAALEEQVRSVEHVGSTAIPGLASKPVLDILAGVASLDGARNSISTLERLHYEFRLDEEIPDRLFFRRRVGGRRTHHLSLAEPGSGFYVRTVLFRDYLRAHPDAVAEYEAVKRELAARFPRDRDAYMRGKTSFIVRALERAERWASQDPA
jgi:GrpB-like predicted nucleotidyltransferase (UPF0157 family)